jgi:hypothetical protein
MTPMFFKQKDWFRWIRAWSYDIKFIHYSFMTKCIYNFPNTCKIFKFNLQLIVSSFLKSFINLIIILKIINAHQKWLPSKQDQFSDHDWRIFICIWCVEIVHFPIQFCIFPWILLCFNNKKLNSKHENIWLLRIWIDYRLLCVVKTWT